MTDRLVALTVILDGQIRDDDAGPLIDAIRQLRGVLDVQPVVGDINAAWALENARSELRRKIWDALEKP